MIDDFRAAFGIDERQHEQFKPVIFPHHHTGHYRDKWKTPGNRLVIANRPVAGSEDCPRR